MKGVEFVSKMENLRNVEIIAVPLFLNYNHPILAHIAGSAPRLQTFYVKYLLSRQGVRFVTHYREYYPNKPLRLLALK